jgi:hypothetical protein
MINIMGCLAYWLCIQLVFEWYRVRIATFYIILCIRFIDLHLRIQVMYVGQCFEVF